MVVPIRTYTRAWIPGGIHFFTVNLAERCNVTLLIGHIEQLRTAFRSVRRSHPSVIAAVVVLPNHLHCIWRLPPGDDRFATRWRLIKARFPVSIADGERIFASRLRKGELVGWAESAKPNMILFYCCVVSGFTSFSPTYEAQSLLRYWRWAGRRPQGPVCRIDSI